MPNDDHLRLCAVAPPDEFTSIDAVRASGAETIYYSAVTCWWTHRADDLGVLPDSGLPCDARGGVLMQTDDVAGFLDAAEGNTAHYGRHGLRAFELAHHGNVVIWRGPLCYPWCFRRWGAYNDLLDRPAILTR